MTPTEPKPSAFSRLLAEMKRRHVGRFALGYLAAAFVLLQLAEILFPAFGLGEVALQWLVIGIVAIFPPAVALAWVFDLTSAGLKRTEDRGEGEAAEEVARSARVVLLVVSTVLLGALGAWLVTDGPLEDDPRGGGGGGPGDLALTEYDPGEPITSLAVLPLDDFSEGGGQEYFTAGMQEELITQLSQVPGLRVVSRTSVARYADGTTPVPVIGRALGVDAVIEGSVVRADDRVRITVQLIHASSDTHVWSDRYDRDLTDILALQSEVAVAVVEAIQGELTPEEESRMRYAAAKTMDPTAQEAYLQGKQAYSTGAPESLAVAMRYFQDAVEADSAFAGAWAGLAGSRFLMSLDDPQLSEQELEQAHQEALRAFTLDTTSLEVREVVASIERTMDRMRPEASETAPDAPRPPPGVHVITLGEGADTVLVDLGGLDTAWVGPVTRLGSELEARLQRMVVRQAEESADERQIYAARRLMTQGLFPQAADVLRNVVETTPEATGAWELLLRSRALSEEATGVADIVAAWAATGAPDAPDAASLGHLQALTDAQGMEGYWRWQLGRLQDRTDAGQPVSPVEMAAAHAALGQTEEALTQLGEGLRQRDRGLLSLHWDPVWDDLRPDPRFQEIARQTRAVRTQAPRRPGGAHP